jgi:WD40 repeat protein
MDSLPVSVNSSGGTGTLHAAIPLDDGMTIVASDGLSIFRWTVDVGRVEDVLFEGNPEHLQGIRSASISPDGRLVATAAGNRAVMIWQADSGKVLWGPLEGHVDGIHALGFSADSKMVVSGSDDGHVRIWSAETGQMICGPLEGHKSRVNAVCFRWILLSFWPF